MFNFNSTANINPKTGISYGYISANALDQDLVDDLMYGEQAINHSADSDFCESLIEGELDGVSYATSWLGGALNFFIFESPHVTDKARQGSICIPNAGVLDALDGEYECYDVPSDWRGEED